MKLPPPLNWLWDGWMKLSLAIGFVMSRVLLTILWIVGVGIYAIAYRIAGLFRTAKPAPFSYWIPTPLDYKDSMKHQF